MCLEVSQLDKQFSTKRGPLVALKNINMLISQSEFVCAVGESGSGKSTLLRLIAGLERPTAGDVYLEGMRVAKLGTNRQIVLYNEILYPWMSVAENVGFGLRLQGMSSARRRQQVADILQLVGLSYFAESLPKELSAGMKQRVAIARSLASQPKVLLMDEPFSTLDLQTKEWMQQFLLQLWRRLGITILMTTCNAEEAVFLGQRVYLLTSRPGTIKQELKILLPGDRTYHIKQHPQFQDYKNELIKLLPSQIEKVTLAS